MATSTRVHQTHALQPHEESPIVSLWQDLMVAYAKVELTRKIAIVTGANYPALIKFNLRESLKRDLELLNCPENLLDEVLSKTLRAIKDAVDGIQIEVDSSGRPASVLFPHERKEPAVS